MPNGWNSRPYLDFTALPASPGAGSGGFVRSAAAFTVSSYSCAGRAATEKLPFAPSNVHSPSSDPCGLMEVTLLILPTIASASDGGSIAQTSTVAACATGTPMQAATAKKRVGGFMASVYTRSRPYDA